MCDKCKELIENDPKLLGNKSKIWANENYSDKEYFEKCFCMGVHFGYHSRGEDLDKLYYEKPVHGCNNIVERVELKRVE